MKNINCKRMKQSYRSVNKDALSLLFVVDYGLDSPNSVGQILRNIYFDSIFSSIVKCILVLGDCFEYLCEENIDGNIQLKFTNDKTHSNIIFRRSIFVIAFFKFLAVIKKVLRRGDASFQTIVVSSSLRFIKRKFKISRVLFLTYSPDKYAYKSGIPYSYFLYDTFLGRPSIDSKSIKMERRVIKRCISYYLAPFFFDNYKEKYPENRKIKSLAYPLFPSIENVRSTQNLDIKYSFSYFGQLQNFRNVSDIAAMFDVLGILVDVFSWQHPVKNKSFVYHQPLIGKEYYKAINQSRCILIFDNNHPYSHYMPSKLYEIIAFSKPIIVIGKNEESATIDFLKDYPYKAFINLNKNPINQLKTLIADECFMGKKDDLYDNYYKFLAIETITKTIFDDFFKK